MMIPPIYWLIFFTVVLLVAIQLFRRRHKRIRLLRWMNKYDLVRHQTTFESLYQGVNGFQLSQQARVQGDAFEYVYGEIDFLSFIALINMTQPQEDSVFYDLGCGTGKAVIACALVHDMKKYVGIELFESLFSACIEQKRKVALLNPERSEKIQFVHESFLNHSLLEATHIFIHATAFIGETWDKLNHLLEKTLKDTIVVTVTKKLISNQFQLVHSTLIQTDWGVATAYLYEHGGQTPESCTSLEQRIE